MKLIVIGACGRTGRLVCEQAIARKIDVIGVVRDECNIDGVKTYLVTRKKDIVDEMMAADVVISVIGHTSISEKGTQTNTIGMVLDMMRATNTNRIVSLTGTGARREGDKVSLFDKALNIPLRIFNSSRVEDGEQHLKALEGSDRYWTALRVLKLSNSQENEPYLLTKGGPAKKLVGRRTVASIMLDLALSNEWVRQAPVVSDK